MALIIKTAPGSGDDCTSTCRIQDAASLAAAASHVHTAVAGVAALDTRGSFRGNMLTGEPEDILDSQAAIYTIFPEELPALQAALQGVEWYTARKQHGSRIFVYLAMDQPRKGSSYLQLVQAAAAALPMLDPVPASRAVPGGDYEATRQGEGMGIDTWLATRQAAEAPATTEAQEPAAQPERASPGQPSTDKASPTAQPAEAQEAPQELPVPVTLHTARVRQVARNTTYPDTRKVRTAVDLAEAARWDLLAANCLSIPDPATGELEVCVRSRKNFVACDCLTFDVDNNTAADGEIRLEENQWLYPDALGEAFPGVTYYTTSSRSNMKQKGEYGPRPRFHIYFPLRNLIRDEQTCSQVKKAILDMCPYFDPKAIDSVHFMFGVEDPQPVGVYPGSRTVDELPELAGILGAPERPQDSSTASEASSIRTAAREAQEPVTLPEEAHDVIRMDRIPDKFRSRKRGSRNSTMVALATWLFRAYGNNPEVETAMLAINQGYDPPMDEDDVSGIFCRQRVFAAETIWTEPGYRSRAQYVADLQAEDAERAAQTAQPGHELPYDAEILADHPWEPRASDNQAMSWDDVISDPGDRPTAEAQKAPGEATQAAGAQIPGSTAGSSDSPRKAGRYQLWEGAETLQPMTPLVGGKTFQDLRYPIECIPEPQREYILALVDQFHVDPAMAATSVFAAFATAAQKVFIISPWPGYEESLSIYSLVVARPSTKKTPVLASVRAPIETWERKWNADHEDEILKWHAAKLTAEAEVDAAKAAAKKKGANHDDSEEKIEEALNRLRQIEANPVLRKTLTTSDATSQAMEALMYANGGRIGIFSDEGGPLENWSGKYTSDNITDIKAILTGYTGKDVLKIHRISREPIVIYDPAISFSLAVQPITLQDVLENRGFTESGFTARCLFTYPVQPADYQIRGSAMPQKVEDAFADSLYELLGMDLILDRGDPDARRELCSLPEEKQQRRIEKRTIHLDKDAELRFESYANELYRRKIGTEASTMEDWAGKAPGHCLRLLGGIHTMRYGADAAAETVRLAEVEDAITLTEYYWRTAERTFEAVPADQATKDAQYIWRKIRASGQAEMTWRDLHHNYTHHKFQHSEDMRAGLQKLWEHGYITIDTSHRDRNNHKSYLIRVAKDAPAE